MIILTRSSIPKIPIATKGLCSNLGGGGDKHLDKTKPFRKMTVKNADLLSGTFLDKQPFRSGKKKKKKKPKTCESNDLLEKWRFESKTVFDHLNNCHLNYSFSEKNPLDQEQEIDLLLGKQFSLSIFVNRWPCIMSWVYKKMEALQFSHDFYKMFAISFERKKTSTRYMYHKLDDISGFYWL